MNAPLEWLLEGEPWIEYRVRRDLMSQDDAAAEVASSRRRMLADPRVQALVAELSGWPGTVIASHKSAGQPFHKLTFLADLGLVAADPGVGTIVARILEHQSPEGPFQLSMNSAAHDGGTGEDRWAWALCDAPLVVYALVGLARRTSRRFGRRSTTWSGSCATTGGRVLSRRSWGPSGARVAGTIRVRSPPWPC